MNSYYEQMVRGNFDTGDYRSYLSDAGRWCMLSARGSFPERGWKFNVSVVRDDIPKAWNIIADILIRDKKHKHWAKVITPGEWQKIPFDPSDISAGKTMVMYTHQDVPPKHYIGLVKRIQRAFEKEGVRAGLPVPDNRKIEGSDYFSYRYDARPNGRYLPMRDLQTIPQAWRFNPFSAYDPYANLSCVKTRGRKVAFDDVAEPKPKAVKRLKRVDSPIL